MMSSVDTPVGRLGLLQDNSQLLFVGWDSSTYQPTTDKVLLDVEKQLSEYFSGDRKVFDIEVSMTGTDFQKKVWAIISSVPYGQTMSYNDIAKKLDSGPRAVANACGKNHIPIIVPCHRILPSSGKLGGYSGGEGPATKRKLLELEGHKF